ncbi:hypothetical protein [Lutimonas sp.]|uniref:hypothetical protein n=1 Tax=Lutimonas sp. TaxID=1872403 RepID=UPI003D9B23DF
MTRKVCILLMSMAFSASLLAQESDTKKMTLITNVKVWDGVSDKVKEADVLIEGGKVYKNELQLP